MSKYFVVVDPDGEPIASTVDISAEDAVDAATSDHRGLDWPDWEEMEDEGYTVREVRLELLGVVEVEDD